MRLLKLWPLCLHSWYYYLSIRYNQGKQLLECPYHSLLDKDILLIIPKTFYLDLLKSQLGILYLILSLSLGKSVQSSPVLFQVQLLQHFSQHLSGIAKEHSCVILIKQGV